VSKFCLADMAMMAMLPYNKLAASTALVPFLFSGQPAYYVQVSRGGGAGGYSRDMSPESTLQPITKV
jgi:hypothetical protein